MDPRAKAHLIDTVGKIFFVFAVAVTLAFAAFGVAYVETEPALGALAFVAAGAVLFLSLFVVFLFKQIEAPYAEEAKRAQAEAEERRRAEEAAMPGEDGLPAPFCREINGYSLPQLRLILDEQKDEYSPEEYAYIEKVYARKENA